MTKPSNQYDQSRSTKRWQAHVTAQQQSGLSRAEYCRQHQLSYHAATYWNRKLSKPAGKEASLVPVTFASHIKIKPVVPVRSVLKVILPNKIAVEIDDGFSPTTLTKLLTTLEKR